MIRFVLVSMISCASLLCALHFILLRPMSYDEAIGIVQLAGYSALPISDTVTFANLYQGLMAEKLSFWDISAMLRQHDVHPPLYFSVLWVWMQLFGSGIVAARCLSLLFAALSLVLFQRLMRGVASDVRVMALSVFAFSSSLVMQAANARIYTSSLFFYLLVSIALLRLIERCKDRSVSWSSFLLLALLVSTAAWTSHLLLFSILGLACWFYWNTLAVLRPRDWLASALAFACAVTAIIFFQDQLGSRSHQFRGFPGVFEQLGITVLMLNRTLWDYPPLELVSLCVLIVLSFIGILKVVRSRVLNHDPQGALYSYAVISILVPCAALFFLGFWHDKSFHFPRYYFLTLPGLSILLALHLGALLRGTVRYLGVAALILLQVAALRSAPAVVPNQGDLDGKKVARELLGKPRKERLVLIGQGYGLGFPAVILSYLSPQTKVMLIGKNSSLHVIANEVASHERIALLRSPDVQTERIENAVVAHLVTNGFEVVGEDVKQGFSEFQRFDSF